MSEIRSFDIRVDLSGCLALYDYYKGVRIEKHEKSWDSVLSKLRCLHSDSIVPDATCKAMDCMFDVKKIYDKKGAVEKDKSDNNACGSVWEEQLNQKTDHTESGSSPELLPARVLPIYKPGDVIRGEVVLDLAESMFADSLIIRFLGRTVINAHAEVEGGMADEFRKEDCINEVQTIWQCGSNQPLEAVALSPTDDVPSTDDKIPLLQGGQDKPNKSNLSPFTVVRPTTSETLPKGISRHKFEFFLSSDIPGSVPPLMPNAGTYAEHFYILQATIGKTGSVIVNRGLWVERPFDIASIPDSLCMVQEEKVIHTGIFGKSGSITVRAQIPRKAWVRCETIPIRVDVDNQSSDELFLVKARVVLESNFINLVSWNAEISGKLFKVKTYLCMEAHVAAHTSPSLQWQIPLNFTLFNVHSNLMPVGTDLNISRYLKLKYFLVVKVKRKRFQKDIKLKIPIILGSEHSGAKS